MKLQNRNLSIDMIGKDVKLLHEELIQLDYSIPSEETTTNKFGTQTQKAVLDFQKKRGLEQLGVNA